MITAHLSQTFNQSALDPIFSRWSIGQSHAGKVLIEQEPPMRNPQRRRERTAVPALRLSRNGTRDETFSLFQNDLLIFEFQKNC
jgi:hypothetical protein